MSLLSANYTNRSINLGLLILRAGISVLMIPHGYDKLANFGKYKEQFLTFLGLSQEISLALCLFAEFFCALFVLFGLFTRLAAIPLIINMTTAVFIAHKGLIFGEGEHAALFLIGFLTLLITGPGKYSADGMFRK